MPSTQPNPNQSRSERLEARITRKQKELFRQAAAIQGRTVTDFIIQAASETAVRIVKDFEVITLTRRDQELFAKALLKPGKPNKKLREAAAEYKKMVHQS